MPQGTTASQLGSGLPDCGDVVVVRMLPGVMHMVHDTMMVMHGRDVVSPGLGLRRDRGGDGKGQGGECEFHGEATHDVVLIAGHWAGMGG